MVAENADKTGSLESVVIFRIPADSKPSRQEVFDISINIEYRNDGVRIVIKIGEIEITIDIP